MSKSPLNPLVPTLCGIAATLAGAYILADQFVVDLPAPARGAFEIVPAANAQEAATPNGAADAARTDDAAATARADAGDAAPEAEMHTASAEADGSGAAASSHEGGYGLGRPALDEEIAAWDIDIRPDGQGLPRGEGDVWTGEELFVAQCAMCHGDFGEGAGRWPQLALGMGTLTSNDPVKTVGSYWPYLSTVWDYVHRAMPFGNAQSLSDDEVYAITAYILYLNEIVEDDFVLSSDSFAEVEMPNAGAFYMDDRAETELPEFSREVCMENCKEDVKITMRARVLDVTPEGGDDAENAPNEAPTPEEAMDGGDHAASDEASADDAAPAEEQQTEIAQADTGGAAPESASTSETEDAPEDIRIVAADPALIEDGAKVFRKCQACHQVGADASNRVGPQLNGLLGRTVGSAEGFSYSSTFEKAHDAGEVWTAEHLAEFLADPRGTYTGTKMSFAGLKDDADIEAVTAYIEAEGAE
ncbi:c-type cytochrome [Roseivivax marinus]|uniref:c-type cytochrome n=1 Tax=Roseivivax marinus TaxID=1379903 RepID=UPI00273F0FD4|nr:c-type cytochrome [Roseivivax marinus]